MNAARLKRTYRPRTKLEVFYTGGAARLSPDGLQLACACGDETKVSACGIHAWCVLGSMNGPGRDLQMFAA
jgi:hypothetical protein